MDSCNFQFLKNQYESKNKSISKTNQYEPMNKSLLLQEPNHEKKNHYRSRKIKISKDVGVEGNKIEEDGLVRKRDGLGEWMREVESVVK